MLKENIIIEDSKKDFNILVEKTNNLKEKIEKEINEIDNIVNEKVNNSFIKKSWAITKRIKWFERKISKVTKVKEQLENFLSETNRLIKISERINKGIKSLEKEEKNKIRFLSHFSKINKNKKEMNGLFKILMRNLKISFEENEKVLIIYENYYFNGIQIPKEFEFQDIETKNFKIFWKIDNINILNIDINNIKFIVEIRKENKNKKFVKV